MKSLDFYKSYTNISLYAWQRDIYSFAYYVSTVLQKNMLIELPTGHGKTPIIAILAKALAD